MSEELVSSELEEIVELCVSEIETGRATVQDCLSTYPHLAAQLEPILRTAASLFATRLPAMDPLGFQIIQKRVLSHAAKLQRETRKSGTPSFVRLVLRLALAAALIVLIAGVESGLLIASASSLPGEPLYVLKRASEGVHLAFTQGSARRAELYIFFAQRRLNEAMQQHRKGQHWDESVLGDLSANLQAAVDELAQSGGATTQDNWQRIAELSQFAEERLAELGDMGPAAHQMLQDLRYVRDRALKAAGRQVETTRTPGPEPAPTLGLLQPTPERPGVPPAAPPARGKLPATSSWQGESHPHANQPSADVTRENKLGKTPDASSHDSEDEGSETTGQQLRHSKGQQTAEVEATPPMAEPAAEMAEPTQAATEQAGPGGPSQTHGEGWSIRDADSGEANGQGQGGSSNCGGGKSGGSGSGKGK